MNFHPNTGDKLKGFLIKKNMGTEMGNICGNMMILSVQTPMVTTPGVVL